MLAVCAPAHVTRLPGSAPGPCFAGSHSPWPPPLAPPTPTRIAPPRSPTSQLLWRGPTSHLRASPASAFAPSRCGPGHVPMVGRGISRFPHEERTHMPGSPTAPSRPDACDSASVRIAFRLAQSVGVSGSASFAAQWLAYAFPCRRFAPVLWHSDARFGADVVRYSFIVVDLHHLLLAGLPAHKRRSNPGPRAPILDCFGTYVPRNDDYAAVSYLRVCSAFEARKRATASACAARSAAPKSTCGRGSSSKWP